MKPGQEFDRIIRKKVEESESQFAFDESNWQKAAGMLDAERGAAGFRKNKMFLLAGALIFILGSVGFFGYKYLNPDRTQVPDNLVSKTNESNLPVVEPAKQVVMNDSKRLAENTALDNSTYKTGASNANAVSSAKENNQGTSESMTESTSSNAETSTATGNAFNGGKENSSFSRTVNSGAKNKGISIGKPDAAQDITTQNSSVSEAQVVANSDGSNMYENLFLNTKVTKIPSHNLDADLRKTSYDFIRIYKDDFYTRKRKTRYLDAEAGTMYMTGWDTKSGRDAAGFNAYAGLNFGFLVKKKFSASIGVQLYNLGNVKHAFYIGSSINYDFGANGTYTAITTNNLAYFSIPVKVIYAIDKRNTIGAGANVGMLFNGMNTVETYNMADGVKSNVKMENTSGYYEGTNTTNVMLSAFYTRAITRRVKLNAEVLYGLSDIYSNKITATNTKENSTGLRFGIQYTLFSK